MYDNRLRRKVFPIGKYSYALTVPKDLLKLLGWQPGEALEVVPDLGKKRIIVKRYKF